MDILIPLVFVCVPNILAGGNLKISTGHDKSKFGIPVDQVEKIIAIS